MKLVPVPEEVTEIRKRRPQFGLREMRYSVGDRIVLFNRRDLSLGQIGHITAIYGGWEYYSSEYPTLYDELYEVTLDSGIVRKGFFWWGLTPC